MPDAFIAGVKPGGLNDTAQIRILLCYLIQSAAPLPRATIEGALLQEELVNYFELGSALADLESNGLVTAGPDGYSVTGKGAIVAGELADGLPRSVRDSAIRAVLHIQSWQHKAAMNHAWVESGADGLRVCCTIADGTSELFHLRLAMPDAQSAEAVKNRFIARGSELYALLIEQLTVPGTEEDEPPAALL